MPFRIFHSHIRAWQQECARVLDNPIPTAEMVVLCSPYMSSLPVEAAQMRFVGAELMRPRTGASASVIADYLAHPAGGGKGRYEAQPERCLAFKSVTDECAVCSVEALVLSPLPCLGDTRRIGRTRNGPTLLRTARRGPLSCALESYARQMTLRSANAGLFTGRGGKGPLLTFNLRITCC